MTTESAGKPPVTHRWIFKYRWVRVVALFASAFTAGGGVATKVHEGGTPEPGFFEQQAFLMLNMRMANFEAKADGLERKVNGLSENVQSNTQTLLRIERLLDGKSAALKQIREQEQALKDLEKATKHGG